MKNYKLNLKDIDPDLAQKVKEQRNKNKKEDEYNLYRGDEYNLYLECADNGKGIDITTNKPLKTYEQWLNS